VSGLLGVLSVPSSVPEHAVMVSATTTSEQKLRMRAQPTRISVSTDQREQVSKC
jgi:hypothetical protein